jgi:molybdenum cofactor biosynthesis enzyme MoaA
MPAEGIQLTSKPELLTLSERIRILHIFTKLGITKIRFTG